MIDIRKYSKIFNKALGDNQWAFTGSAALSMYGKNAKVKTRNVVTRFGYFSDYRKRSMLF